MRTYSTFYSYKPLILFFESLFRSVSLVPAEPVQGDAPPPHLYHGRAFQVRHYVRRSSGHRQGACRGPSLHKIRQGLPPVSVAASRRVCPTSDNGWATQGRDRSHEAIVQRVLSGRIHARGGWSALISQPEVWKCEEVEYKPMWRVNIELSTVSTYLTEFFSLSINQLLFICFRFCPA